MSLRIEVIKVEVEAAPNGKKYKVATVFYKMGSKDYIRKVMSFGDGKLVYDVLSTNPPGWFDIEIDESTQYKNWIKATPAKAPDPVANSEAKVSPKSTYETAEERAFRQLMIARQSSLDRAVQVVESKDVGKVLETADIFVEYVTQGLEKALEKLAYQELAPEDRAFQKLKDLEDDIPF